VDAAQAQNIAFPTDARLYDKARKKLVKAARKAPALLLLFWLPWTFLAFLRALYRSFHERRGLSFNL
jgi:hypothetical protein